MTEDQTTDLTCGSCGQPVQVADVTHIGDAPTPYHRDCVQTDLPNVSSLDEGERLRAELIRVMCNAYCRTSGAGGGKERYATAMARVLSAIETSGYEVIRRNVGYPKQMLAREIIAEVENANR